MVEGQDFCDTLFTFTCVVELGLSYGDFHAVVLRPQSSEGEVELDGTRHVVSSGSLRTEDNSHALEVLGIITTSSVVAGNEELVVFFDSDVLRRHLVYLGSLLRQPEGVTYLEKYCDVY